MGKFERIPNTPQSIKTACFAYVSVVQARSNADPADTEHWKTIHRQLAAATRLAAKLAKPVRKEGM